MTSLRLELGASQAGRDWGMAAGALKAPDSTPAGLGARCLATLMHTEVCETEQRGLQYK